MNDAEARAEMEALAVELERHAGLLRGFLGPPPDGWKGGALRLHWAGVAATQAEVGKTSRRLDRLWRRLNQQVRREADAKEGKDG